MTTTEYHRHVLEGHRRHLTQRAASVVVVVVAIVGAAVAIAAEGGDGIAHRVGVDPQFVHADDYEIVVFQPWQGYDHPTVNMETTVKAGILKMEEMGLVQSRVAHLIFTMDPSFAGGHLFDEDNRGRVLALFRNLVDLAVSMFHFLQTTMSMTVAWGR